jgi:hypothetical protein
VILSHITGRRPRTKKDARLPASHFMALRFARQDFALLLCCEQTVTKVRRLGIDFIEQKFYNAGYFFEARASALFVPFRSAL